MDWKQWTLATTQLASGTTDMFLWNKTTGALVLWSNLAFTTNENGGGTLTFTSSTLADGVTTAFEKGAEVTLEAADIDSDGTPDLWSVADGRTVTAWINTGDAVVAGGTQVLSIPAPN